MPSLPERMRRAESQLKAIHEDEVRESLRILSQLPSDRWSAKLREFAARYGCEDQEVQDGIANLVGEVVLRTAKAGDAQIEEGDLTVAFTSCRSAKALTYENLQKRSLETVKAFSRPYTAGHSVRQRILDDLSREARQRALVILEGPGGSGKTTALADWCARSQNRHAQKSAP